MKKNIILFIGLLIVIIYIIFSNITGFSIPTAYHTLTGFLCPGCGTTRMFKALINGEIIKAFYYNQFVFISLPIFVILFINLVYANFKNIKSWLMKIPNWVYYTYAVLLILFGVIRNIIKNLKILIFMIK